ncbi:hypothetical protein GCM10023231_24100 [Olivibacter ginsenosidimutans]|uniref:DoxX family protein n=1 Tax=Olivibacter ginsenosidimutans TaxID=1176537 RepID=A0ABP9BFK2_9SPHI
MNGILWILQFIVAITFLYSGINKSIYSERKLVERGQTGVEGLPLTLIRFIGRSEILGSMGLILPSLLHLFPVLTVISAICLAIIMIPAALIHYRRNEPKNILTNAILFLMCVFIAYGRSI